MASSTARSILRFGFPSRETLYDQRPMRTLPRRLAQLTLPATTLLLLGALVQAKPAKMKAAHPSPGLDVVDMITCKVPIEAYTAMTMELATHPEKTKAWGWKADPDTGGVFLKTYRLPQPITIYGETTSRIGFSGSSIVALLKATKARDLAKRLVLTAVIDREPLLIFGKTLRSTDEKLPSGEHSLTKKVDLTVSSSPDFPGLTLAGCSYSVDLH